MRKRQPVSWLSLVKENWWLVPVVICVSSAITFAVNAKPRLEAAEQKNIEQDAQLAELRGIEQTQLRLLEKMVAQEVNEDGVRVMDYNGQKLCCDNIGCWPYSNVRKCAR